MEVLMGKSINGESSIATFDERLTIPNWVARLWPCLIIHNSQVSALASVWKSGAARILRLCGRNVSVLDRSSASAVSQHSNHSKAGNLCTVPPVPQNISTTSEKEQNQCQDKHQQHGSEDHLGLPSGPMQFTPDQHPPGGADQRLTPRDGHRNGVPQHSTCLDGEQTAQAMGETSREAQEVLPGRQFWIAPNQKSREVREIAGRW